MYFAWFAVEGCFGKSGGGPPHSKTLARNAVASDNAKRLGVRQSSGALKDATAFRVEEMFGALTQGSAVRATLG